ncbi:uncharacterized protein N7503_006729 [Penicillium pulvis]|uniref:uncharacterized protein n=1 Tax=Penicillium pulvis TaxID=1562058 RepID=UPI00254747F2|nr:uncharacterized protein N7503_006729 [Penicillium pulvis]KAJ5797433.1 hypothetical protein N7503_006729 [Penicillium pulvis]
MDDNNRNNPLQNGRATRSSLACLSCRSRHLKCDAKQPRCSRCAEFSRECQYAQSRRGGLDRAALTERRKRLAAIEDSRLNTNPSLQRSAGLQSGVQGSSTGIVEVDLSNSYGVINETSTGARSSSTGSLSTVSVQFSSIENDPLIDCYYKKFHQLHPFLLPQRYLTRAYQDPTRQHSLKALIAIMRLVGSIYKSHQWSTPLQEHAEAGLLQLLPTDPVMVQCRMLYSIALFWYEQKSESQGQMNIAVQTARDMEMFKQEFAVRHGGGDPVLQESWRRTWWMLYTIEACYQGTLGTMLFEVANVDATVELPCEEAEYELGDIPTPKTLNDFDCREFAPDDIDFSSFAYLIGAVIQTADSILGAWLLLLPKNRKQVLRKNGEIDELMFQAHHLIHVSYIGLHRPLSDLKFNPVEEASSCAREPPEDIAAPDLVNVHTVRVLRSVEAQIRLLALPTAEFHHSPFITCMVSEGTLALLSACHFLLKGKELAIAREQIRMSIGCLKALAELWPRTARNVRELQTIAHHVLGIGSKLTTQPSEGSDFSSCQSQGDAFGSETGTSSDDFNILPSLGSIDDLCGWYNIGDLDPNIAWEN